MPPLYNALLIIIGFVLLYFGGEFSLRGGIGLAKRLGITPALIGLTVIGFGTSAPELFVSLKATWQGHPDLAIGNVVGSNIANILLILGIASLIAPLPVCGKKIWRDMAMTVISAIILIILAQTNWILPWQGALMFLTLVGYITWCYYADRCDSRRHKDRECAQKPAEIEEEVANAPIELRKNIPLILIGLIALTVGAYALVTGAVAIAVIFGIPQSIIGLSVVAIGTSLPELATTVIATYHRHTELAIANIIGSFLFNALCILGLSSLVHRLPFPLDIKLMDIWIMFASLLLLIAVLFFRGKLGRTSGLIFLVLYVGYISFLGFRADKRIDQHLDRSHHTSITRMLPSNILLTQAFPKRILEASAHLQLHSPL